MEFQQDFHQDFFALFGLPRRFALDRADLEHRYHEIQARVHPDKHSAKSETDRRLAMQWATRVNEAYRTLREPLSRAHYLLQLAGIELEVNGPLPAEFLMQQLEWREAVEEAKIAADVAELEHLHRRLSQTMDEQYRELAVAFERPHVDHAAIADQVRRLMFQEKLLLEIDDALSGVEA